MKTVNVLQPANLKTHPLCTHWNLIEDPLIVLRCYTHVFRYVGKTNSYNLKSLLFHSRCPVVFEILLRILTVYLLVSSIMPLEHATFNIILTPLNIQSVVIWSMLIPWHVHPSYCPSCCNRIQASSKLL